MGHPAFGRLALGAAACFAVAHVWAQALPTAKPEDVGMSAERLGRITAVLKKEIADGKLPGAVVMVARKGRLVYSQAFGSRSVPADAHEGDSIFRIYSMTKPLVSVAADDAGRRRQGATHRPGVEVPARVQEPDGQRAHARPGVGRRELQDWCRPIASLPFKDLLRHTSGIAYGELTRNTLVRDAYVKANVYKPTLDFDARDLPAEQAERLGKAPLASSRARPGSTACRSTCRAESSRRCRASA